MNQETSNVKSGAGAQDAMKTRKTQSRRSLERLIIQRLLRKWRRKSKEFGKQVRPEWEHGDKYASRRYEGESIAMRWCCEDLEAALYNAPHKPRGENQ